MISAEQIAALQHTIRQVQWHPEVEDYLLEIVQATRSHASVSLEVSPRGTLAFYCACEAYVAIQGRDYVQPDDVKRVAPAVLAHHLRGNAADAVSSEIVNALLVPVETTLSPGQR